MPSFPLSKRHHLGSARFEKPQPLSQDQCQCHSQAKDQYQAWEEQVLVAKRLGLLSEDPRGHVLGSHVLQPLVHQLSEQAGLDGLEDCVVKHGLELGVMTQSECQLGLEAVFEVCKRFQLAIAGICQYGYKHSRFGSIQYLLLECLCVVICCYYRSKTAITTKTDFADFSKFYFNDLMFYVWLQKVFENLFKRSK